MCDSLNWCTGICFLCILCSVNVCLLVRGVGVGRRAVSCIGFAGFKLHLADVNLVVWKGYGK